jgi:hypothetical protein
MPRIFFKGDRVEWATAPHWTGTIESTERGQIHVCWDNGKSITYGKTLDHRRLLITARLPNPTFTFCRHGGVDDGKHCPICLNLTR